MKILFIDDEAENGWKEVIEKVLFSGESIDVAIDENSAVIKLKDESYDLIILDLRFGEADHGTKDISKYSGYSVLKNEIRGSIDKSNFATPVLLFTASNKAWNINDMINIGADDFYIKEHPDSAHDLDFSRKNYTRLKNSIPKLLDLGQNRKKVWIKISEIVKHLPSSIENENIKLRILEKLKIGYGLLFRKTTEVERAQLLFNNEATSFIVFWSILEEISHDFYRRTKKEEIEWTLRINNNKIQYIDSEGTIKSFFPTIKAEHNSISNLENNEYAYQVNLSNQIAGILRYKMGKNYNQIRTYFLDKLNAYRNDIDFIHSSTSAINKFSLKQNQDSKEGFDKSLQMLDFILELLK